MARFDLWGPWEGEWIEFDPRVPLGLLESAFEGQEGALEDFLRRCVKTWSFGDPPAALELADLPWDLPALVPVAFCEAHRVSDEEEADIMCRVFTGNALVAIPELNKLHLCERLQVPYARSYDDLPAGEILRLTKLLSIESEIKQEKGD